MDYKIVDYVIGAFAFSGAGSVALVLGGSYLISRPLVKKFIILPKDAVDPRIYRRFGYRRVEYTLHGEMDYQSVISFVDPLVVNEVELKND